MKNNRLEWKASSPGFQVRLIALVAAVFLLAAGVFNFTWHRTNLGPESDGYPQFIKVAYHGEGYGLDKWPIRRAPLLLILSIPIAEVIGDPVRAGQIVSLLSAALLLVFGGLLGLMLTDRWIVAGLVSLLLALSESVFYFGMVSATDMLFSGLATAGFFWLFRQFVKPSPVNPLFAGLFFAAAYMSRYQGVLFLALGLPALLIINSAWSKRLTALVWYLVGILLVIVPVAWSANRLYGVTFDTVVGAMLLTNTDLVRVGGAEGSFWNRAGTLLANSHYCYGLVHFLYLTTGLPFVLALLGLPPLVSRLGSKDRRWLVAGTFFIIYFLGVGWHDAHADYLYRPGDSRRYFLPLLPFVFIGCASFITSLRRPFRDLLIALVCGWLLVVAWWQLAPIARRPPNAEAMFAEEFHQRIEQPDPLVIGWPMEMTNGFRRFHLVYPDRRPEKTPGKIAPNNILQVPYQYLVLPESLVHAAQKQDPADDWVTTGHRLLFCAHRYCALSPDPSSNAGIDP